MCVCVCVNHGHYLTLDCLIMLFSYLMPSTTYRMPVYNLLSGYYLQHLSLFSRFLTKKINHYIFIVYIYIFSEFKLCFSSSDKLIVFFSVIIIKSKFYYKKLQTLTAHALFRKPIYSYAHAQ